MRVVITPLPNWQFKGEGRDGRPLWVQFSLFWCNLQGKLAKILGWGPHLWSWHPFPICQILDPPLQDYTGLDPLPTLSLKVSWSVVPLSIQICEISFFTKCCSCQGKRKRHTTRGVTSPGVGTLVPAGGGGTSVPTRGGVPHSQMGRTCEKTGVPLKKGHRTRGWDTPPEWTWTRGPPQKGHGTGQRLGRDLRSEPRAPPPLCLTDRRLWKHNLPSYFVRRR